MAKVIITQDYLEDIADAIREKTGLSDTYKPSEMAPAIMTISGGGGIVPSGTTSITSNGTYNVSTYAVADVDVDNSYAASDQGKVVSNGALVSQSAATYTQNSTYDTTLVNSVTVDVPSTGGTAAISVVDTPDAHGGTVRTITALDISDTTAVSADVAQGKYFYTADGTKTTGTASSGGTTINTDGVYSVTSGDTITVGNGFNGKIEVSQNPVLIYNWDFTTSLTDTIGGLTVTLNNGATQNSSGITLSAANHYVDIPLHYSGHMTYELDIASASKAFTSGHGRLFMATPTEGFIAQNGANWACYLGGAWSGSVGSLSDVSLDNTTIKIESTSEIMQYLIGASASYYPWKIYKNGTHLCSVRVGEPPQQGNITMSIGSAGGASFYDLVVTGLRIFQGVTY